MDRAAVTGTVPGHFFSPTRAAVEEGSRMGVVKKNVLAPYRSGRVDKLCREGRMSHKHKHRSKKKARRAPPGTSPGTLVVDPEAPKRNPRKRA